MVEITDRPDYDKDKIKEIIGVTEKSITADARLIELAWWMKEQYGSTMNQALKTVLPVKKRVKARNKKIVETVAGDDGAAGRRSGTGQGKIGRKSGSGMERSGRASGRWFSHLLKF